MTELRAWQREALDEWHRTGRRAVVEAVTGSGKTEVGIAAAKEAVREGRQVLVVVPSRDLLRQWFDRLRTAGIGGRVGRRGDGFRDTFRECDVLISTVQSSIGPTVKRPHDGALLIADEVHRYGADSFSKVLSDVFEIRLGLTATLERSDDGIERVLKPFFENTIVGCTYQRGYEDGILAPVNVALVPVPFLPNERVRYENLDEMARAERFALIEQHGCRGEPFGVFLQDVQLLAGDDYGDSSARSARRYLKAFAERRELLATVKGKDAALATIAQALNRSGRTLVFAETKSAAASAADVLRDQGIAAAPYTSDLTRTERIDLLNSFKRGAVSALAAPRVLDEGIDVPEADLGIVVAASKSRRQMIQRMGRVIRPKADGRAAVFIVMFAEGSSEDPECGAHGTFLEQLTDIAQHYPRIEATKVAELLDVWLPVAADAGPMSDEVRTLTSEAVSRVAERAESVHRQSAVVRDAVAAATRYGRADELDTILVALVDLDPLDAQIVVHRFGLDGEEPLEATAIAAVLNCDPDEVAHRGDEAILALELAPMTSDEPIDFEKGLGGKRSSSNWSKSPVIRNERAGLRHFTLPRKDGQGSSHSNRHASVGSTVRIFIECEGGHMPLAGLDTRTWKVTLDSEIRGRHEFADPDEAAVALFGFYGDVDSEQIDGWALWRIQGSNQAIGTLRR
ncbi:DEAD/DEAH box helicase [Gordonia sp. NPDC003424]